MCRIEGRGYHRNCALLLVAALAACGGGGGGGGAAVAPTLPDFTPGALPANRVSADSPFNTNCAGSAQTGTLYRNAEVEPYLAVNPGNSSNLIGVWQQDRYSSGGSQGLLAGVSTNGGQTWVLRSTTFSRCSGGNSVNGGDYARASDPWVDFSPNGNAYQVALAFTGEVFAAGSANAVRVSRSTDGGLSWDAPITLQRDGADAFNDKQSLTADSSDSNYAYVVWDRLTGNLGPTWFAATINGGASWGAARVIYDPGANSQTIGNQIINVPGPALLNVFTRIDYNAGGTVSRVRLQTMRSSDHGSSWSPPVDVADVQSVGARDPDTGRPIRDGSLLGSPAVGPGGLLYMAWQDARFSGGVHDAIVFARSSDGGLSWSAPTRISAVANVDAFTPSITVRSDGVIGVSYYDLRSNTSSAATLPADYWLTRSSDGVNWTEQHLSGPFDLALAPDAKGLFLGDYQLLKSIGLNFFAFFSQTTGSASANRSDIFAVTPSNTLTSANRSKASFGVASAGPVPAMTPEFEQRIQQNALLRMSQPPLRRWMSVSQTALLR